MLARAEAGQGWQRLASAQCGPELAGAQWGWLGLAGAGWGWPGLAGAGRGWLAGWDSFLSLVLANIKISNDRLQILNLSKDVSQKLNLDKMVKI